MPHPAPIAPIAPIAPVAPVATCRPPRGVEDDALASDRDRGALARALQQLTLAESMAGPCQPAGLCQAMTEVARALSSRRAYGPAESHLVQAPRRTPAIGTCPTP